MTAVFVQNDSEKDVVIPRNTRIGEVIEYEADGCYLATPNDADLAAKPARPVRSKSGSGSWWKKALATAAVVAAGVFHSGMPTSSPATNPPMPSSISSLSMPSPLSNSSIPSSISTLPETILPNGITIYGSSGDVARPTSVSEAYPRLWTDQGNTSTFPNQSGWIFRCWIIGKSYTNPDKPE